MVVCAHITTETANLALTFKAGGADAVLCASNPLSTQDDVAAALVDEGISVFAIKGEDARNLPPPYHAALDHKPHIVIDDGADVVNALHTDRAPNCSTRSSAAPRRRPPASSAKGDGGRGVLQFPIVAVNDADTKHFFDNRYGTGQSTIDGIIRATKS